MEINDTLILLSLTQTEINAITSPDESGILYNSTTKKIQAYNGTTWDNASGSGDMIASVYDPTGVTGDVYEYENFKGVLQVINDIISPSTITSNQNNYSPTGFGSANLLRLNLSGDREITGFEAPPAGENRIFYIQNISNSKLKFKNNNSGSLPINRILNKDYRDKDLKKGECGAYWYDHVSNRWRPYTRIG